MWGFGKGIKLEFLKGRSGLESPALKSDSLVVFSKVEVPFS